jgi:hypothetical protein
MKGKLNKRVTETVIKTHTLNLLFPPNGAPSVSRDVLMCEEEQSI